MIPPASWPCVEEFPEKNGAGLSPRLAKTVKAEGRVSNSYLFAGGTMEELMKVLDPAWPGGIPHTVLVDAEGKVIWRHSGPVDGEELRAKVLAHLGNYYRP